MAGWRPLKFQSVKELQDKIDSYYQSCYEISEEWVKKKIKPFTITWLAVYLDTNRQTLINYEDRSDEFFDAIKRRKSIVEEDIETWLLMNKYNSTWAIFNLKNNFDWKDKTEVDNTNTNYELQEDSLSEAQKKLIVKRYGNN